MHKIKITLAVSLLSLPVTALAEQNPWDLIQSIEYSERESNGEWAVEKSFPPELQSNLANFSVTGFYVPIQVEPYVTQFIMVPDPADCPFCGESGYGPTLEVSLSKPVKDMAEGTKITVKGLLKRDTSTETYRALFITNGAITQSGT